MGSLNVAGILALAVSASLNTTPVAGEEHCQQVQQYVQAQLAGQVVTPEQHEVWGQRLEAALPAGEWAKCELSLRQQVALAFTFRDDDAARTRAVSVLRAGIGRATTALDIATLANDAVSFQLRSFDREQAERSHAVARAILDEAFARLPAWDALMAKCQRGEEDFLALTFVAPMRLYRATALHDAAERMQALLALESDIRAAKAAAEAARKPQDFQIATYRTLTAISQQWLAEPGADVNALEAELASRGVADARGTITAAVMHADELSREITRTRIRQFNALRAAWGPDAERIRLHGICVPMLVGELMAAGVPQQEASAAFDDENAKLWDDIVAVEARGGVVDRATVKNVLWSRVSTTKDPALRQSYYERFPEDGQIWGEAGRPVQPDHRAMRVIR